MTMAQLEAASLLHLMHLDDVAIRVVEEDLVPAVHGPAAVVGKGVPLSFRRS